MKTIYKYPIKIVDHQVLNLPMGAEILTVQTQKGEPFLWAKVDTDERETTEVNIYVHGTGHPVRDETAVYLGTIQQFNGDLIWHVFWNYKS